MKIVGHRGARGLAKENTVDSIKKAEALGVDFIELDVRYTSDGQLILHHDRSLYFSCGVNKMVDELTLAQISRLADRVNYPISSLQHALDAVRNTPLILEIKETGTALLLHGQMGKAQNIRHQWLVTSRRHSELAQLKQLRPDIKQLYTVLLNHPYKTIRTARLSGAYGLNINVWIMSLLIYFLCRRAGLRTMLYVYKPSFILNSPAIVWVLQKAYPGVWVCSDRPDKLRTLQKS